MPQAWEDAKADDHHDAGPGDHRIVEPPACVHVEVVGRLVEEQNVRPPQEQRGQHGLAAGQPLHPVIQAESGQSEPVSQARARSSTSQSSPMAAKASSASLSSEPHRNSPADGIRAMPMVTSVRAA
jgi:hypothetical protein